MRALVLTNSGLQVQEIPRPPLTADGIRILLQAAALNHRDQYIVEGKYSKIVLPAVLGSDGVGIVAEAPSRPHMIGQRVVIDPSLQWGSDPRAQGSNYAILGMPTQGTLAEEIVVPATNVHKAPSHLTNDEAAALPLAGVTAYRAIMRQAALQSGETVLITGIGGGVATLAMMFALASYSRVIVTSTKQHKLDAALALGAHHGVLTTDENWPKRVKEIGPVDCAVDSLGGDMVNGILDVLRPGGRLATYGASRGAAPMLNMHRIFWKQLTIVGSTMGTTEDFANMLAFVDAKQIRPIVDSVYSLDHAHDGFVRLHNTEQFGKIVVQCN